MLHSGVKGGRRQVFKDKKRNRKKTLKKFFAQIFNEEKFIKNSIDAQPALPK